MNKIVDQISVQLVMSTFAFLLSDAFTSLKVMISSSKFIII
jgi:hypothetical protein